MKRTIITLLAIASVLGCSKPAQTSESQTLDRKFIAHRGVDLNHTIAGENSLEAVSLAKSAGFDAVETDVRYTEDNVLVVMHDATLGRTCLNADGSEITGEIKVNAKTLEELKSQYVLKADDPGRRSHIPTLEEYLTHCKNVGIFVFIEPKLNDDTGVFYKEIINLADRILGRDGYIVTSNNYANNIIRGTLGNKDVRLMGILYQTTWEALSELGNCIFAISATRYQDPEYQANVAKAKAEGRLTESTADKFVNFDMVNRSGVDWVSTDMLVPDYKGQGTVLTDWQDKTVTFGGEYLELEFTGSANVKLGKQSFSISAPEGETGKIRYQVAIYNTKPIYSLSGKSEDFRILGESFKVVEF